MTEKLDINKKLDNLSFIKKLLLIVCLLLILGAIFYLTTLKHIETVKYTKHGETICTEIYINGKLNTTPCLDNTNFYPKTPQWQLGQTLDLDSINFT